MTASLCHAETIDPDTDVVRDDRGAVMVLGIFMCCILAGSLWYLAGIGDAIIYRERVQEAADAAAFSSAALHARGMNLIVLLNLLMAIILGIRVAMKVLQLVCLVLGAIFAGICLIPVFGTWACAIHPPLFAAANYLQQAINQTRNPINQAIKALSKLQLGIIRGTPLASVAGSTQVGNRYRPVVTFAFGAISSNRATGLQVVESTEDKLCGKAGASIVALFQILANKVGLPGRALGPIRDAMESIARAGAAYFCEIGGGGSPPTGALNDLFRDGARQTCEDKPAGLRAKYNEEMAEWQQQCSAANASCGGADLLRPSNTYLNTSSQTPQSAVAALQAKQREVNAAGRDIETFDEDDCRRQEERRMRDQAAGSGMPANGGSNQPAANGQGMTPKKLIASGRDEFFDGCNDSQIMGLVWSSKASLDLAPSLVRVASLSHRDTVDTGRQPSLLGDFAGRGLPASWAQAEYFYDCGPVNFRSDRRCDGEEEAMWHFRWRPRLRRYSRPYNDVGALTDGLALTYRAFIGQQLASHGLNGIHIANGVLRGELSIAAATRPVDLH